MKTSIGLEMEWSIFYMTGLIALLLYPCSLVAQVDFNQKQSITINENSGPLLSLKNQNASAFSELQILNDQSSGFTLGISGSTNQFFNNFTQIPYLFNNSNHDFHFWSDGTESYVFHIDGATRAQVGNTGLNILGGNHLSLTSDNGQEVMAMNTNNDGQLQIKQNGVQGNTVLVIEDDAPRVGINNGFPSSELHILQDALPILNTLGTSVTSNYGIKLSKWNVVQNSIDDLSFIYDGIWRSYISSSNGNYINSSDRRLKENIEPLKPCLDKIMKLVPAKYNYRNSRRETIGLIAQEVESVFPELIYHQGQYKALAYDNFTILAIKAIQEQQLIINDLRDKLIENTVLREKQQNELEVLQQEISALSEKIEVFASQN